MLRAIARLSPNRAVGSGTLVGALLSLSAAVNCAQESPRAKLENPSVPRTNVETKGSGLGVLSGMRKSESGRMPRSPAVNAFPAALSLKGMRKPSAGGLALLDSAIARLSPRRAAIASAAAIAPSSSPKKVGPLRPSVPVVPGSRLLSKRSS